MKTLCKFVLFVALLPISPCVHSQSGGSRPYKEYHSVGEFKDGVKVGRWIDLSPDSIIYAESIYDSAGMPAGTWKINLPGGGPRRAIRYGSHKPVQWNVYRYHQNLLEVGADTLIPASVLSRLNTYEAHLFDEELTGRTMVVTSNRTTGQTQYSGYINPYGYILAHSPAVILKEEKFSGSLLVYNYDNTVRKKYKFDQGHEFYTVYTYDKKKHVTQEDDYDGDKLVKRTKYGSNGEKKIKTF